MEDITSKIQSFLRGRFPNESKKKLEGLVRDWLSLAKIKFPSDLQKGYAELWALAIRENDFERLKKRVLLEKGFFKNLLQENKKFRIRIKPYHVWPDGDTVTYNLISFECPLGNEIGFTKFSSEKSKLTMLFFQGHRTADVKKANKILERQWHNVFMDAIVKAFSPMHKEGVSLVFSAPSSKAILPRKIRKKYFQRPTEKGVHFLARERNSVKRYLR